MESGATTQALTALGIGIALAAAPGPVQAVLLSESARGGVARGLRALTGVHVTFGLLLLFLALGLTIVAPSGPALRILKMAGGVLLLWLALDGVRSRSASDRDAGSRTLSPAIRGALAIVLNPGGWLFAAAVASPLLVTATQHGGTGGAALAAVALVVGAALGDLGLVLLAGLGLRRAGKEVVRFVRLTLAVVLAGLGLWLIVDAL
ncbi:MAG TPA: LysE family transporter [Actinomycetota bacterium]|nr:LysE family transporter [Actinomycetota bacterium]